MSDSSRRDLMTLGAGALAGAALAAGGASAQAQGDEAMTNERIVRKYYGSWGTTNWTPFEAMLADSFTFSSPYDDHINKATFKTKCWESQTGFIKSFDLEVLMAKGDTVMVEYLCHTMNGKALRNVELHRLRNGKIESIACYFGADSSFPSAVSAQKN
jgi:hypothetical protein